MTNQEPDKVPHWSEPGWDKLPYAVKAASMQAFLQRVGYDPEKARQEDEKRRLEERVSSLEHEVQVLKLELRRWVAAEQAAAQQRLNAQKNL